MEEEKKQELATEGEEDDDGPPPGFQCIITPRPPQEEKAEADDDEEEEDGPPPGFHSVGPKSPPSLPPDFVDSGLYLCKFSATTIYNAIKFNLSPVTVQITGLNIPDMARSSKQDDIDDDEDGPPPGWEFSTLVNALPKPLSNTTDISDLKTESNDELDEGPPPGWETVLSHQMPPPHTPPLQPSTVSSNIEMGSKQNITRNDEVLPSVSQGTTTPGHSSPATPLIHQLPSSELPGDKGKKEEEKRSGDKRPTSGHQPVSPRQQLPSTTRPSTPATVASSSERAQLVCGTCRKLCLYPRGAKWVQCPGCREVNFVLEAHDIGQVKCGGCSVLLMPTIGDLLCLFSRPKPRDGVVPTELISLCALCFDLLAENMITSFSISR
ncbi:UNVERIFIED_CONTAM: protein LOL2 [Sesamum radiatum]|uniref:Protein LOL2 n=1 Tax=Sesamum radiatum TaxID=300843 RepID=A0AAW2K1W3_SESRA